MQSYSNLRTFGFDIITEDEKLVYQLATETQKEIIDLDWLKTNLDDEPSIHYIHQFKTFPPLSSPPSKNEKLCIYGQVSLVLHSRHTKRHNKEDTTPSWATEVEQ